MAVQIQVRRDTAANWTSNDPTLAAGEIGFETDTNKIKLGDGATAWTSLAYLLLTDIVQDTTPQLGGDLDAQAKRIYDVKVLDFKAPTELTIAAGAITVTQTFHTVDTEADAATDDLDTINGGSDGRLIVLKAVNDARTVVVKHNTGNIWLQGKADISLDDISDGLMLVYSATDSKWFDIAAGGGGGGGLNNVVEDTTPQLGGDLDCQTKRLYDIKLFDLKAPTELTISSGAITITQSQHTVDTEGDAATDDLDTINGGGSAYGRLLFIRPAADTRTIVVKHNTGNIWLKGKADLSLDEVGDGLLLIFTGSGWLDVGTGGGGGGASAWTGLTDTPGGITANKVVRGNAGGTALEFAETGKHTAMCWAFRNANQNNLPNNTWTKIQVNAEQYDPGNNFDTATYKFVAPVAGYYLLVGNVGFINLVADKRYMVGLYVNTTRVCWVAYHASYTGACYGNASTVVHLAAGDEVFLYGNPDAGVSTVDVFGHASYPDITFLAVCLLVAD